MSKTIEKDLKTIKSSFEGFLTDLDAISAIIIVLKETRAKMEEGGKLTTEYIDESMTAETIRQSAIIAGKLDIITASVDDLKEAALNILNASDIFEDVRITPAVAAVSVLKGAEGARASENIARQFAGNFPVLNLLVASAGDALVKDAIRKHSIDAEGLETMTDNISDEIGKMTTFNASHDMTAVSTRIYKFSQLLSKDADIFGIDLKIENYKALTALMEAKHDEDVRAAFGLA